MSSIQCLVLLAAACDGLALGSRPLTSRRAVLAGALALPAAAGTASAAEEDLIDVYFGCGCFWHVQHEFVEAERKILGRSDSELTAFTGYAGGRAGLRDGKVCYHNAAQVSDYGSMGHAEVVGLRIPRASFGEFATEYCKLFDKNGFRPDQLGDRGTEYRNLVAMPGGSSGDLAKELVRASNPPLHKTAPFGFRQPCMAGRAAGLSGYRAVLLVMGWWGSHRCLCAEAWGAARRVLEGW